MNNKYDGEWHHDKTWLELVVFGRNAHGQFPLMSLVVSGERAMKTYYLAKLRGIQYFSFRKKHHFHKPKRLHFILRNFGSKEDYTCCQSMKLNRYGVRGEYFIFFWKFYPMPNHDIKNSTLASKVMFWTLPLIKCKTHQIWPTLKWKSWFFSFFSSFFTKNPCFPDKFYPSQKNPRNYNPMNIDIFFKIFTPVWRCWKLMKCQTFWFVKVLLTAK